MKPQIITFLAPKGGAGRTTAVIALASAFVESDGFPPLVIDATDEAQLGHRSKTTLGLWHQQMRRSGVPKGKFGFRRASTSEDLTDIIEAETRNRFPDHSPILIDTSARLDGLALTAAAHADLMIAPFTDALTAHRVSEALDDVDLGGKPLYGLRCGGACDDAEHRAVRAAFTAGRMFQHGLPTCDLLADISTGGHVSHVLTELMVQTAGYSFTDPAREPVRRAMQTRGELGRLADEILLALDGYELRRRTPMPRRNPLPLSRLAELLPT